MSAANPALAQAPRSNGPFVGLFGGDLSQQRSESFDVRGSVFGGYEHMTVPGNETNSFDTQVEQGSFSGGSGSITYDRITERARFRSNGDANLWQYPSLSQGLTFGGAGSAMFSRNVTRRVSVDTRGDVSYSPFYQFSPLLFEGGAPVARSTVPDTGILAPGVGNASLTEDNINLHASAGIGSALSKRSNLTGALEWRQSRLLESPANDVNRFGVNGRFEHRLKKPLSLRAGYGVEYVTYGASDSNSIADRDSLNRVIDVGVDYGDSLTFARRTSVSFGTSTAVIQFGNETHYRLNGMASITRGIRRTWSASARYVRDSDYALGFRAPLMTDSLNGWFGGLINPRTRWGTGGAFSRGTVGFDAPDSFYTYIVTTRLERGLTRHVGISTQYSYYKYQVPPSSTLLPLSDMFSRHTLTAGLTFWAPIISDSKRTPE